MGYNGNGISQLNLSLKKARNMSLYYIVLQWPN